MQDFSNRRYEIEAEIGRGGMGIVYRALDRLVGQKIAIKRVGTSAEDLIYGSWTKSVDRRLSLAWEFQTLASLWHPNIIRVLDYGFDAENLPYFSMDLLEEPQRITDYGKTLPQEQKIHLIWQILLALKYLHRRGVLHRDLSCAQRKTKEQQHNFRNARIHGTGSIFGITGQRSLGSLRSGCNCF